jgi:hypothetical protein
MSNGTDPADGLHIDDALQPGEASAADDPGPPYLLVDLYPGDEGPAPPFDVLARTPGFFGVIIKATQGTSDWYNDSGWFKRNWPRVKDAGGDRYGTTWLRGAYHFLNFWQDGAKQADAYLTAVDHAGGWGEGDILPIVDVEQGGERNPNRKATAQQVEDCTTAWAEAVKERTGRRICLYGRGAMRELGINSKMGCDVVWNPAYTAIMVTNGLFPAWTLDDIALWQYCGDGDAAFAKLPHTIAGFGDGKVDISVHIDGARKPTLDSLLKALVGPAPVSSDR